MSKETSMTQEIDNSTITPTKRLLLMLALTALWSPSFLFIKVAVTELPPLTVVWMRVFGAALVLYMILRLKGEVLPSKGTFWGHMTMMSLLSSVIPFGLFCYSEQFIESALAAILNGCTPMFTAILAQLLLPSDRLTPQKMVGIALSGGGLLLLFAPDIIHGFTGSSTGILAASCAAFVYASSHIYAKKYLTGQRPFVAPTAQMMLSSLILFPIALLWEEPFAYPKPSMYAIASIAGLAIFGTVIAFSIYYKLMETSGPTAISAVACFFPVGGMILGVVFLGETFTLWSLFASSLILLGLMIVNEVIPLPAFGKEPIVD